MRSKQGWRQQYENNPFTHHRRIVANRPLEEELSKPRFAQKRDGIHAEVVEFLEKNQCEALDLSAFGGCPDLLARFRTEIPAFIEIKMPGSGARYTRKQLEFIRDKRRFDVAIVTSAEDALFALKSRRFLTEQDRDRLAGLLIRSDKKLFTPKQVLDALTK